MGGAVNVSTAEVSRIERGLAPRVPLSTLARLAGAAGLDLVLRTYPGPAPIRDAAHVRLLADFRDCLHPDVRWATEVPLPRIGDQRSWDAMLFGREWRFGVEAETAPTDSQALARRARLKERDGLVDGMLLILRKTRRAREFLAAAGDVIETFPVPARRSSRAYAPGNGRPAAP